MECVLSISYTVSQKSPTQGHIWHVIISWHFFLSLLIFADEENSNCNPNIHCADSEISEQMSDEDQTQDGLTHT